jgi:hypothetical protein
LPGVCAAGTTACVGGTIVCQQNTQPSAEVCDGLDNDCDGIVDDGPICGPNATCAGLAGCQCNPGFRNCDGTFTNGCETNVNSDVNNCGGCGVHCPPGFLCANGSCICQFGQVCFNGTCLSTFCQFPDQFNPQQCRCCRPQGVTCISGGQCCSGNCFFGICT